MKDGIPLKISCTSYIQSYILYSTSNWEHQTINGRNYHDIRCDKPTIPPYHIPEYRGIWYYTFSMFSICLLYVFVFFLFLRFCCSHGFIFIYWFIAFHHVLVPSDLNKRTYVMSIWSQYLLITNIQTLLLSLITRHQIKFWIFFVNNVWNQFLASCKSLVERNFK